MPPVSPTHAYHFAELQRNCAPTGKIPICTVEQIVGAEKSSEACASIVDPLIEAGLVSWSVDGLRVTMPSEFRGIDLSGKDLSGIDLSFADLSGTNFNGADLRGANFRRTRLFETSFRGADLEETDFRNVISFRADFRGSSMTGMGAAGSCFAGANFSGAEMAGMRVGTPLQTVTDWNGSTISTDQCEGLCSIAYNSHLMADVLRKPSPSSPHSEPLALSVEARKLSTWRSSLVTIALEYTEMAEPVFKFMRSHHDKMVSDIFEIELATLSLLCVGSTVEEFSEELLRQKLPPVWQIFFRRQRDSQRGCQRGLADLVNANILEKLGGCSDEIWRTSDRKIPRSGGIVSRISAKERTMLGKVIEAAEPLTFPELSTRLGSDADYYLRPLTADRMSAAENKNSDRQGLLTSRELTVLKLVSEGYSNKQICEELYVSVATVKSHVNRLFQKLGTHRRTQAVAKATELHLLDDLEKS